MQFDNIQFAKGWFKSATETSFHSNDPVMQDVMRFFCAYVAFNSLYSAYRETEKTPERTAVRKFVKCALQRIRIATGRNYSLRAAYETIPDFNREIRSGVKEYRLEDHEWHDETLFDHDSSEIVAFQRIYTIRCNLFHGMKAPHDDDRDRRLVVEGFYVLSHFLSVYLSLPESSIREW
jgi:hypothetical protein